jgi:hypothetical protein
LKETLWQLRIFTGPKAASGASFLTVAQDNGGVEYCVLVHATRHGPRLTITRSARLGQVVVQIDYCRRRMMIIMMFPPAGEKKIIEHSRVLHRPMFLHSSH